MLILLPQLVNTISSDVAQGQRDIRIVTEKERISTLEQRIAELEQQLSDQDSTIAVSDDDDTDDDIPDNVASF